MASIEESRTGFLAQMKRFILDSAERARFEAVLDDLLAWSDAQGDRVRFAGDRDYKTEVVSFERASDHAVLWTVYPDQKRGAKLEIRAHGERTMPETVEARAREVLQALSKEQIPVGTTLRIPFSALKKPESRDQVKALLGRFLSDWASF